VISIEQFEAIRDVAAVAIVVSIILTFCLALERT
jgi:hypothetical protein